MINIREKGAGGEREWAKELNAIVERVLADLKLPERETAHLRNCIQRNQNQSAEGGADMSNAFGIAFEIKRQEDLSVNTWWAQACAAAARDKHFPVLAYRKNHQPWTVVMYGSLPLPQVDLRSSSQSVRVQIRMQDFEIWFYHWVKRKIENGECERR